jgi:hypothetical protein
MLSLVSYLSNARASEIVRSLTRAAITTLVLQASHRTNCPKSKLAETSIELAGMPSERSSAARMG